MRRRPSSAPLVPLVACLLALGCVSMPPEVKQVFAPPTPEENSHFRLVATAPLPSATPPCEASPAVGGAAASSTPAAPAVPATGTETPPAAPVPTPTSDPAPPPSAPPAPAVTGTPAPGGTP